MFKEETCYSSSPLLSLLSQPRLLYYRVILGLTLTRASSCPSSVVGSGHKEVTVEARDTTPPRPGLTVGGLEATLARLQFKCIFLGFHNKCLNVIVHINLMVQKYVSDSVISFFSDLLWCENMIGYKIYTCLASFTVGGFGAMLPRLGSNLYFYDFFINIYAQLYVLICLCKNALVILRSVSTVTYFGMTIWPGTKCIHVSFSNTYHIMTVQ